ncbi:lipopolysaccharide biosynthesis protein [Aquincola sp. MAHUQ-54]|uniref:Lipopolysaccharide biosynthesis protein n=1 Tax=Aquincola agrisoli TaxID=3119538 RepID=A0AAW9QBM8_9BURK
MLLRHTLNYLPAQMLAPVAQLASIILWTHWLPPEEMGFFALVTATQELTYMLCMGWFSMYVLRFLPDASEGAARDRFLRTESVLLLLAMVPVVAVAAVTAWVLPSAHPRWHTLVAVTACIGSRMLAAHYAERARAQSSFVAYNLLQASGPVLGLGLGMLALQWLPPTATVLWLGYAAAQLIGVCLAVPLMGARLRGGRLDREVVREAWRFGSRFLVLAGLVWVAENYIRYLVQWQVGAAALGLLAVGWGLGRRCATVGVMLVTTAAFPLASRLLNQGRREDALQQLRINAGMLLAVILPLTVGFGIVGPMLVQLVVATAYRDATADIVALSVLSGTLHCLHVHVTDQLLVLERRFDLAARVDLVEIAVGATATLIGLHLGGLRGAVLGVAVGSLAAVACSTYWSGQLGFTWPWGDVLRVLAATAAMAAVLVWLGSRSGVGALVMEVAAGASTYVAAIAVLYAPRLLKELQLRRRAAAPPAV